jgi:type IV fimbrial biogenesis protein FimT
MQLHNALVVIQRGLTLVDMCAAMAVATVLASLAIPSMDRIRKKHELDGLAGEIATDIHFARSESLARNQGVRISFLLAANGGQCMVVHTGSAADCTCADEANLQCSPPAKLLKAHVFMPGAGTHVGANVPSMRFDPVRGTVTPAGTVAVASSDGRTVHHVVSPMGRLRSCSPGATASGYKAC